MMRWMNLRRFGNPCSKDNWTNYEKVIFRKISSSRFHNVTNSNFLRENHCWFWTLSKTRELFFLMKIIFDWLGTFALFWDQLKIIWFRSIKRMIQWMNHVRDGAIYVQFCTIIDWFCSRTVYRKVLSLFDVHPKSINKLITYTLKQKKAWS